MTKSESDTGENFRLVTRSDFDGLVCAVLLKEHDLIDEVAFAHPKDMQDGLVTITEADITTNLPYVSGVHLAFDHHASEAMRVGDIPNHIIDPDAPSAARVVYDYYGGKATFPSVDDGLMEAVDKADSAQLDRSDVDDPQGWILLNYLMDARTGLGRFRDFRVSNYELMMNLIDLCRRETIETILEDPDVKERVDIYREHAEKFREQLMRCTRVESNLIVIDLRDEETIWSGNRFQVYTLFPDANISIHALRGKANQNTVFAIGKSIFNRSSRTNVGELCLSFRGGGHEAAGTCQVAIENAENVLEALTRRINLDG